MGPIAPNTQPGSCPEHLQEKIARLEEAGCDPSPAKVKDTRAGSKRLPESRFAGFDVGAATGSRPRLERCAPGSGLSACGERLSGAKPFAGEKPFTGEKPLAGGQSGLTSGGHWFVCTQAIANVNDLVLNTPEARDQLRRFQYDCLQASTGVGEPLDIENDEPLQFVLKAQSMDVSRRKIGYPSASCSSILVRAITENNLYVTCKIMQGLVVAKEQGLLDEECLYLEGREMGRGPLHSPAFGEADSGWRQLILNTGVFDPNRLSRQCELGVTPLFCAMDYSQGCVADLMKANADPNLGSTLGITPLEKCIRPLTKDKVGKLNALLDLAPRAGIDVNFIFDVRRDGMHLFKGSPLAAAAFWFLDDAHYPVEMVEKLASGGACLLTEDPSGILVDWTGSSATWIQEELGQNSNMVFPEEKVEQLQEAIKRGWALGARAGKGKAGTPRSSVAWTSIWNTRKHGVPS